MIMIMVMIIIYNKGAQLTTVVFSGALMLIWTQACKPFGYYVPCKRRQYVSDA